MAAALDRLRANAHVEGVLAVGSMAAGTLAPSSDYDLVIVLSGVAAAWTVGVTAIGGRFTDLLYVSAGAVERVAALEGAPGEGDELAPVARWLRGGEILFDRQGMVRRAQRRAREGAPVAPPSEEAAHGAWFALNYNLAVAERLAAADDPLRVEVADIRMAVYGPADLWWHYFTIRRLPWEGDKPALRALVEGDPAYLELFRRFIDARERADKLAAYRRAAAHAAAPLGGLWAGPLDETNVREPPWTWAALAGEPPEEWIRQA